MRLIFIVCIWFLIHVQCNKEVRGEEKDDDLKEILLTLIDRVDNLEKKFDELQKPSKIMDEPGQGQLNDTKIEERVTILEFQVAGLTEDVTDLGVEVTDLGDEIDVIDGEIAVILTGQVIQDERILELEADSEVYEDSIADLVEVVWVVNFTLSGEIQDVDTGLIALGDTVAELEGRMENLEGELTSIEELINELDTRIGKMEVAGTVAFEADLDAYTTIPVDSYVVFNQTHLNIGNGYNSTTGAFTVPPGGDGLYFFYISFKLSDQERATFRITKNAAGACRAETDFDNAGVNDKGMISCGTIQLVVEGDVIQVHYEGGTDDTPVPGGNLNYNMFSGFRVAPE